MIKLFKDKSLKNNTKTEQGADNKNTKKQRGRSMVEMLGVLAIIGVLSIGGISGYTLAMRRYRVNEILNFINRYAFEQYASFEKKWNDGYFEKVCSDTTYHHDPCWACDAPFGNDGSQINRCLVSYYQDTDGIKDAPQELSEIGFSGIRIGTSYPDVVQITLSFKTLEMCNTFCSATNNDMCACEGDRTIPGEWYQSTYTGDMEYKEPITIKGRQAVSLLVIEE